MWGLTFLLATATAFASPASTAGTANAGPALAGDTVVWGQEYADGRAVLYSRAPGQPRRALLRLAAVKGRGHKRDFGGVPGAVSASPSQVAFALQDSVSRREDSDVVGIEAYVEPQLSTVGSPFTNPLGCRGAYVSTAVEGDTVAIGVYGGQTCEGIWIAGSPARRISTDAMMRQVRLAGPWVAWVSPNERTIKVADVATGALVATFPGKWDVFDIDERGNIVASLGNRIVAFTVSDSHQRVLARRIWSSTVATAGGRVAYIAADKRGGPGRLLLIDLQGHVLRRLYRYGPARRPTGEVALTDRRAAWSVLHTRDEYAVVGPGSVLTVSLP
jgi:hypothetical protein